VWLQVPEVIKNVLWEGPLEPATEEAVERLSGEWAAREVKAGIRDAKTGRFVTEDYAKKHPNTKVIETAKQPKPKKVKSDIRESIRDLPVLSIGQPVVWLLAQVYPLEKMPPVLRAKLQEADFYLVRLACSFRPKRDETQVEWARFLVHLLPDNIGHQPIAFDLHPLQVTQEVKRNVKVSLSPTLKFQEIEVSVGGVEFGFEYPELQPIISAAGAGEAEPSWDYEAAKGVRVQGSKWMHLLVKAPKGMPSGQAILDLAADVLVRGSRLPVLVFRNRKEAEAHLTVRLWG
jgi:hypothetical protein